MFKHSSNFNYKIQGARSENCVLIDSEKWLLNDSNAIIGINSRGGIANTYITEVLAANFSEDLINRERDLKEGDKILITAVAARLYGARPFKIPLNFDSSRYTDIPFAHIIGIFRAGMISVASLSLLGSYILLERVKGVDEIDGLQVTTNHTESIYKVCQKSSTAALEIIDDYILLRDNVTTPIMLDGVQYYAASYKDVIAGFGNNPEKFTLETVKNVYNNYFVMTDEQIQEAFDGSNIYKPNYDFEQDDEYITEIYDESRFKVVLSGNKDFNKGDVLYAIREPLEYCTLHGKKYYVTNSKQFILAKVTGE